MPAKPKTADKDKQIDNLIVALEEVSRHNTELCAEATELAQEIEDLEDELALAKADISIILSEMKKNGLNMTFVKRLKTLELE